jgi:hypothetical protein
MTTVPRTITLRARLVTPDLVAGALVAGVNGRTIYRILAVTRLRTAGDPAAADRVRLVLHRLAADQVPAGEAVLPWPRAPRPGRRPGAIRSTADPGPPEPGAAGIARIRAKAPLLFAMAAQAIREGRAADAIGQLARAARVGRDGGYEGGRDYGPGLRLAPVHGRRRTGVLRDADAWIEDGADPDNPNRTVRRARRADPLVPLQRAGKVSSRQCAAAECLREDLEQAECRSSTSGFSDAPTAAHHQRVGISDRQLESSTRVRRALLYVSGANQLVVLWVAVGGSLDGYLRYARERRDGSVSDRLAGGLEQLANYYFGMPRDTSEIRSASFGTVEMA